MFAAYVPLATVKVMVSSDIKMEGNYILILNFIFKESINLSRVEDKHFYEEN